MSTEEALHAEIIADPAAEAPRRVLADLLARGDPRGELIAVQCDAAALDEDDPRRWALEDRAEELLRAHKQAWDRELRGLLNVGGTEYRRGFVEKADFAWGPLKEALPAVRARTPLRALRIDASLSIMEEAVDVPEIGELEELDLTVHDNDESGDAFQLWPHQGRLRSLWLRIDMGDGHPEEEGLTLVASTPALRGLRRLRARGDYGLHDLARAEQLASLVALDVGGGRWVSATRSIATSAVLTGLEELTIDGVRAGGLHAVMTSPNLTRLRALRLRALTCDDADLAAFEAAPLPQLHTLELGSPRGPELLAALARKHEGRPLRELALAGDFGDDDVIRALDAPRLRALQVLRIQGDALTSRTVAAIVASPLRETLRSLHLHGDPAVAVAVLAADLPGLRRLSFDGYALPRDIQDLLWARFGAGLELR